MRQTEFFSHTTAAVLWGVPLPVLEDHRLNVSVFRPRRAPRGANVRGHEIDPRLVRVTDLDGLPVTTPASTWASLGALLSPYDLVAAGDAVVCVRSSTGGNGSPPRPPWPRPTSFAPRSTPVDARASVPSAMPSDASAPAPGPGSKPGYD
jgi:hypothetical protein